MGKTKRSLSPRGSSFAGVAKKGETLGRKKTSKDSTLSHFSMYKMKPFNIKMAQASQKAPMLSPTATRKKHTDIMLMAEELLLGVSATALAHSPSLRQMLKKASRTLKPVLLSKTLDKNSFGNSSVESLGNNSKRFTVSKSPSSKRDLSHGSDSNTSVISPCNVNRDENSQGE